MPYDQNLLNVDPYYDDFNEDKKFHKILFKPGYAVQARELTQLQTILQNQVSRFGDHIFEEGSKVVGGEVSVQNGQFLRCVKGLNLNNFIGYTITQVKQGESTPVSAKVVHGIGSELSGSDDYDVLFITLISGNTFESGGTFASSYSGASLDGTVATVSETASDSTVVDGVQGRAKLIQVNEGIYYTDGFFAKNDRQVTTIYSKNVNGVRDFDNPTGYIGFNVTKEVVTDSDDSTLKDPASGTYNYNAPGADRLKVNLDLGFTTSTPGQDFIEIAKFSSGNVEYTNIYSDYAELEDTLARRTYDESGSYIVDPFDIEIKEHLSDGSNRGVYSLADGGSADKLAAVLDPGKAYVFGYEFETQSPTTIEIDKSRTTGTTPNQRIPQSIGNVFRTRIARDNTFYHDLIGPGSNVVDGRVQVSLYKRLGENVLAKVADMEIQKIKNNSTLRSDVDLYATNIELKSGESLSTAASNLLSSEYYITPINLNQTLEEVPEKNGRCISLTLPNFDSLLYELPQGRVAKTIKSMNFLYQEIHQVEVSSLSSSLTIQTKTSDSTHKFYNPDATGTSVLVNPLYHYSIYYTEDGQNFIRFPELIENSLVFSIPPTDQQSMTISGLPISGGIGSDSTVTYMVVATIEVDDDSGSTVTSPTIRTKSITTVADEAIDTYTTDAGGRRYLELSNYDVYEITAVSGITAADFSFDNGQRETFYGYGRLYFEENLSTYFDNLNTEDEELKTDLAITVSYRHFTHSGGPGPFTVDSYTNSGVTYDNIPLFASKELGKTVSLASCIDFRHSGDVERHQSSSSVVPDNSNISVKESHDYYQSRIDKIVLRRFSGDDDVEFEVIKGTPELVPTEPEDRFDSMTLYSLVVPPYTHNPTDVKIKPVDNTRYTMRDIGEVNKRVETLEYFSKLSLLEREIESRTVNKISGAVGTKTGILVDSFLGHAVGNVQSPKYNVAIDYENQVCRNGFVPNNISYNMDSGIIGGNLTKSSDNILHLTPTESIFIDNSFSSTTENINRFNLTNWIGSASLDPATDDWFDTNYRPIVKFNERGENDNWLINNYDGSLASGTRWNDWEGIWFGLESTVESLLKIAGKRFLESPRIKNKVDVVTPLTETNTSIVSSVTETTSQRNTRFGLTLTSVSSSLLRKINNKVIDLSVAPFMRQKTITINARNMKPNTRVYPFFDGVDVSAYCTPSGGAAGSPILTGSSGDVSNLQFTIPVGTFTTGSRIFRLLDSSTNSLADAETSADGVYHAVGLKNTIESNYASVRPAIKRRQSADSERFVADSSTRSNRFSTSTNVQWSDPMAQIFTVNQEDYPDGMFLHNVEIYFATKSETLPVTLQIRPVAPSGRPSPSVILPFSEVVKNPSDVTAVEGGRGSSTKFQFSTPVFLQPGNYAVVLSSNTDDYSVYISENGLNDDISGGQIQSAKNLGPLYLPQNFGEIIGNISKKLSVKINRCEFSTSGTFQVTSNEVSSDVLVDYARVNSSQFVPRGCSISNDVLFGATSLTTRSNQNRELSSRQTIYQTPSESQIQKNTITMQSSNSIKTPMIDLDSYSLTAVAHRDTSTYITRQVTLETPSKELHVFIDKNYGGTIESVKARILRSSDTVSSIENAPTITLSLVESTSEDSTSPLVFNEKYYRASVTQDFDKFLIEVELATSDANSKKLPVQMKDLRVVSLL